MPDLDILKQVTFGARVAEEEGDLLESYFVETAQWSQIVAGDVDVVYGPKGSGKSALHSLLLKRADAFFDRQILLIMAENPRGAAAFTNLKTDPPSSESEFVGMWKLYFLVLLAARLSTFDVSNAPARKLFAALEQAGLRETGLSLGALVRLVVEYVHRINVETTMQVDPNSGMPILSGKISLGEPGVEQRRAGFHSLDELLGIADEAFAQAGYQVWLLLDRLDVAFVDTPTLEENALRALFKAYLDCLPLQSIRLKIFLRSDIWRRLTANGFREASHITRELTIQWDEQSLLNLMVKRMLGNEVVRRVYDVTETTLSRTEQLAFFARALPNQIDLGERKPSTLTWILSRTRDGTELSAPREIIHLLNAAKDSQIKSLELGEEDGGTYLIGRTAFKSGLEEVSKARLEKTIYMEYSRLQPAIARLEGAKTAQSTETLAEIWGVPIEEARNTAQELLDIGFFEARGGRDNPVYWVPFLYRDALNLVQGAASPQIAEAD